ncbi:glycerophosphodiester phosphodiesterase family protein [Aestuariicoccus sp. MJ-SS9]|uniref:glycerophosphodiester phosphodiesterase family protein n=1 Tax=Aestuariicoccus sp. MJ-SS9 TaxID=3079855 RepID=UPI00290678D1|nr:glycerophosphodiester phosphodiesterase family protein [Aestuariicoccus sp. MJ-SS9]MDU8912614.1 glycerophosphodiester phosphodiesterase family protein [Aestuariicoccus sp. MJ-SS9]
MRVPLPQPFLDRPIAHRGYHGPHAPENSRAAFRRAIEAGYPIEMDLQLSADGHAKVFHDYHLDRLTSASGAVRQRAAAELAAIPLVGGSEGIPPFKEVLDLVAGQVPLLIELKDQDGAMGPDVGPLETAVAAALAGYEGPVALMSFNPHSVAECARLLPEVPRGLVTDAFTATSWPNVPEPVRDRLRGIPDADRVEASFISHDARDLGRPRVAELKARGLTILCWTIRSPEAEAQARRVAQNVTFEGYAA